MYISLKAQVYFTFHSLAAFKVYSPEMIVDGNGPARHSPRACAVVRSESVRPKKIACTRTAVFFFFYYYALHQNNTTRNIQM